MIKEPELIYVFLGGSAVKTSSVQQKIIAQIKGLNQAGIHCTGWFFTQEVVTDSHLSSEVILKPLEKQEVKGIFGKYMEKQRQIRLIHEELERNGGQAYFFIRHMRSGKAYFRLLQKLGARIFLYIPSNSLLEQYHEFRSGWNGSPAVRLLKLISYTFNIWLPERLFYRNYTRKVRSCVAFTPEFCDIIRKRSGGRAKVIYNRDGADAEYVPVRQPQDAEGKVKLLFMKGSQSVQRWSGLDRLVRSIEAKGGNSFELYITGKVLDAEKYSQPFIHLTGRLPENDLAALINRVDLGVSNLANYMIGFTQTTNLKSREYFMRGLPFIQANTMPDIEGTPLQEYYLNLPNDDSLIDMDLVYEFACRTRGIPDHSVIMRRYAEQMLDWNVTARELAESISTELQQLEVLRS
jgi:hypothetical protein